MKMINKKYRNFIYIIIPFIIFLLILTSVYVNCGDYPYGVYCGNHYFKHILISKLFFSNFSAFLQYIIEGLFFSDDNGLNIIPLIPFYFLKKFPPPSVLPFIFGICFTYILPLMMVLIYLIYSKFIKYSGKNTLMNVYVITGIIFLPFLYFLYLKGFVDIPSLIIFYYTIFRYINYKFEDKIDIKNSLILGVLLYFIFLLRRSFIVQDISLVVSLIIISILRSIFPFKSCNISNIKQKLKNIFINLNLIPALVFLILIFIVQHGYFLSCIQAQNNVYDAYKSDFIINLTNFVTILGLWNCILLIISIFTILITNKTHIKGDTLFILVFINSVLLQGIYIIGNSYFAWFYISAELIIIMGLYKMYTVLKYKLKSPFIANIIIIICLLFNMLNFTIFLTNKGNILNNNKISNLFSKCLFNEYSYPTEFLSKKSFYNVYNILSKKLDTNPNLRIAIFTSNETVHQSMFELYSAYYEDGLMDHLETSSEYFNYEGFRFINNLNADYIITTAPVRLYSDAMNFIPLKIISDNFSKDSEIRRYYKLLYSDEARTNEGGSDSKYTVYLFERISPVPPTAVANLLLQAIQLAPNHKDVYKKQIKEYEVYYNELYSQ